MIIFALFSPPPFSNLSSGFSSLRSKKSPTEHREQRKRTKKYSNKKRNKKTEEMWVVSGKTDNVPDNVAAIPLMVAFLALNLIGLSFGSPLPQRLNHSSSLVPLIPLTSSSHPLSHSSWTDSNSDSDLSSSSHQDGHSQPSSTTANAEQVDRVQLLSSPWEPGQFNLPFSVSNCYLYRLCFFFLFHTSFFSLLFCFFFVRDMSVCLV